MDRYEYKLKLDQIKEFMNEKKYQEAAEVADTVNWKKVKTVSALCVAGDAYEKGERYEDSRDLYLMAYDRSPIGRTIIFRLSMVAVKAGKFDEALDYYDEFVEIAPTDHLKYILKYQIYKAKGAPLAELISILEEYKEQESSERWSFELATLYHRAGMAGKCVDACDELILWYGDGNYVEKALELKMLYQPLNKMQEEIYRKIRQNKEGIVEVTPTDNLNSGEIVRDAVKIPKITTPPLTFNTINLQAELAQNMKQIMEATKKESVSNHMNTIKNLVKDIPYLNMPEEGEEQRKGTDLHIETDEEIDGSLEIDFKEMLAEDYDGQITLNVPNLEPEEPQINGQMSIEDVLEEWEKTKRVAQAALQAAEARKLESAKARAIQEAEGILGRLQDVIPQLDAGVTPRQIMEEKILNREEEPKVEEKSAMQTNGDTISLNDILSRVDKGLDDNLVSETAAAIAESEVPEEESDVPMKFLTEEQKEIFSYFVPVAGMEKQLCQVMSGIKSRTNPTNSAAGNVVVIGGRGSGKTVLATNLIKALQKLTGHSGAKVGKISASSLNKKDVMSLTNRMAGGYLIIEKAGELTRETATKLSLAMESATAGMIVILEDTKSGIEQLFREEQELAKKFTEKISIPIFTNDELVAFAKSYANELEYEIDEMAVLALYNRINTIQKLDRATTLTEVKEIVDGAIDKAEKGGLRKAITGVFTRRYNENDFLILKEKDFDK
ncbi:MAG: tetratricopeptide repeat protein [Lachnospiraceae bacterium]